MHPFISQVRIPVGNSNFQEIREKDLYYVDKTGFISELLNYTDKVQLITRPRRFGKTLMMSMLNSFFDIEQDSKDLFSGLEISRNEVLCAEWINQYPVIFLTFKEIEGLDFEAAYEGFFELKRTKKKEQMNASCERALKQIKKVGYVNEFVDDYDEIICYGVSFYKKSCLVKTVD